MFLIEVFVNFLALSVVGALKLNVYITFRNITEIDKFTKVYYVLNVYKGASIPLDLNRDFDILTADYYSREQKFIFTRKIFFTDKKSKVLINDYTLMLESGNNDTIKSIIKFKLQPSFENIASCWKKANLLYYGKLYITNVEILNDLKVLEGVPEELIIYSRIDAYFAVCSRKDRDFETLCERDVDFCYSDNFAYLIVIFMVSGFIATMIFINMLVFFFNRSRMCSNRVSPLMAKYTVHIFNL